MVKRGWFDMKRQLFFMGEMPKKSDVSFDLTPALNGNEKPKKALWASTFHETYGSDWAQYHLWEMDGVGSNPNRRENIQGSIIELTDNANVYTIDSYNDYQHLVKNFMSDASLPQENYIQLDFEKMSQFGVDALHITKNGLRECNRKGHLKNYDVESFMIFNQDCFQVKEKGEFEITQISRNKLEKVMDERNKNLSSDPFSHEYRLERAKIKGAEKKRWQRQIETGKEFTLY